MATRPPELSMDAKWEAAIDLTLRRLVYGSLAGGAAGLLLFRAYPTATRMTREKTRPSHPIVSPAPSRAPVLPNANTDLTRDSARPFEQAARGVARRPWRSVPAPRWAPLTPVRRSRTLDDDGFLLGVKTRETSPVPRRASVPPRLARLSGATRR